MALAFVVVFGWLFCVCLHEFGHAIVAYAGGDDSVKSKGYLTLNLLRYIDPSLSLILPALIMAMGGIGLPGAAVYINESKLRNRFWRSAVAVAGPAMTLLTTWVISLPISQGWVPLQSWVSEALAVIILFNTASTFLNLMPLPPLDGYGVIQPWLPVSLQNRVRSIPPGAAILGILLLFSYVEPVRDVLWTSTDLVVDALGVPIALVGLGYREFHKFGLAVVLVLLCGLWLMNRGKGTRAAMAVGGPDPAGEEPPGGQPGQQQ